MANPQLNDGDNGQGTSVLNPSPNVDASSDPNPQSVSPTESARGTVEPSDAKPKVLRIKLYSNDMNETGLPLEAKIGIGIGATALGIGGAVLAAPLAIAAHAGVGLAIAGGVASGSLAASFLSRSEKLLSSLQSAGAAGLRAMGIAEAPAVGAASAEMEGGLIAEGVKKKISIQKLEAIFALYDKDEDDIISHDDLRNILLDLNLNMKDEEFETSLEVSTGCTDKGSVSYEEFLRLFDVKLFNGEKLRAKLEDIFTKFEDDSKRVISLEDLEDMLTAVGVIATVDDILSAYKYATGLDIRAPVTLEIFLEMCGFNCHADEATTERNFKLIFDQTKDEDEKINLIEFMEILSIINILSVSESETAISKIQPNKLDNFLLSYNECLGYFKHNFHSKKKLLIFQLIILCEEFQKRCTPSDDKISFKELKNVLVKRGNNLGIRELRKKMESFKSQNFTEPLSFHEFLKMFNINFDNCQFKKLTKLDITFSNFITNDDLESYLINLDLDIGINELKNVYKTVTKNEDNEVFSFKEFLHVLLLLNEVKFENIF